MLKYKKLVVKVGTSTLTHSTGKLNLKRIGRLVSVLADLNNRGVQVALVSSGAVGVGASRLGLRERPFDTKTKQAAAAVGQCALMHIYDKLFGEYGLVVAQLLLTRDVTENPVSRVNVENTFNTLLLHDVVPIVNENDTVSTYELDRMTGFGENDSLAATVAEVIKADLLINLSDIDGLYDSDPHENEDARLIPLVTQIDEYITSLGGGSGSKGGSGGMATKLSAAKRLCANGIPMVISNGEHPEYIYDICEGLARGTMFRASGEDSK